MMPSSTDYPNGLRVALLPLIFTLSILLPSGPGLVLSQSSNSDGGVGVLQQRRLALGSRPPVCVNRCLSCRPCMATLVVSPHQRRPSTASAHGGDDSYYLLAWKCACGDKLFQP